MCDFTLSIFGNIDYLRSQELIDSIAPKNAEIRTAPELLPLNLKNSTQYLSIS
jgi:hypothetical protein